ncbi:uncharacterized protein [Elaeis guineensis]|uniref:uncharacterized protein n=1 Tax=Elaeis guineensis var. tenera TaxID=51953 RepID=UPI003C6D891D
MGMEVEYKQIILSEMLLQFSHAWWRDLSLRVLHLETPTPKKAKLFAWLCYHDKILAVENLIRKGVDIINRCCFCGDNGETTNHIMVQCEYSKTYWRTLLGKLIVIELLSTYRDIWDNWRRQDLVAH